MILITTKIQQSAGGKMICENSVHGFAASPTEQLYAKALSVAMTIVSQKLAEAQGGAFSCTVGGNGPTEDLNEMIRKAMERVKG